MFFDFHYRLVYWSCFSYHLTEVINVVLDSWGKVESGIWDGNVVWEGRYHQCLDSNFAENVSGKYCLVEAALPTDVRMQFDCASFSF